MRILKSNIMDRGYTPFGFMYFEYLRNFKSVRLLYPIVFIKHNQYKSKLARVYLLYFFFFFLKILYIVSVYLSKQDITVTGHVKQLSMFIDKDL